MSKRKVLMRRKIGQALRAGRSADVVRPKMLSRRSLVKIFEAHEKKP